jgi:hypothetical protein
MGGSSPPPPINIKGSNAFKEHINALQHINQVGGLSANKQNATPLMSSIFI